ncbi:hypothetical protein EES41_36810 (plasmid) [Streptomyces sp. ADI95-16]|uniref:hypothetical protein n=1 Tax=Streptomyces sp. ADI95-16 TaxID=1522758 RepID=UPI000F3A8241|nr:hypothetical protein [Streptomyces sp. ADI95-16]AYV32323.1 hypothetical protein EES41_36810 [Streptomyces sp. ADI95-16]
MTLLIVSASLALIAGLSASRYLRPGVLNEDGDTGMAGMGLVGPLPTPAVPLPAFVLATANGSHGTAGAAARGEARKVNCRAI